MEKDDNFGFYPVEEISENPDRMATGALRTASALNLQVFETSPQPQDWGNGYAPTITEIGRISPLREWMLLVRQYLLMLISAKKDLIISIAFPAIAALITVWIAGEDMFNHYDGTKSACFVLVSAAIWGGLFNSIQTVVKERANIRRDFMAGLRLRTYIMSRALVQLLICAAQSAILCVGIMAVSWCYGNELPNQGALLASPILEYYISVLLLMYAADAMGLMFSCMVRKAETASVMAPYVLIVQLIFSGILFDMDGASELLSYTMLSRWGMEAMGSTSNLNALPLKLQEEVPILVHETEDMFEHTGTHVGLTWLALGLFAIVFVLVGCVMLRRMATDSR